jgi:hypothetical protein
VDLVCVLLFFHLCDAGVLWEQELEARERTLSEEQSAVRYAEEEVARREAMVVEERRGLADKSEKMRWEHEEQAKKLRADVQREVREKGWGGGEREKDGEAKTFRGLVRVRGVRGQGEEGAQQRRALNPKPWTPNPKPQTLKGEEGAQQRRALAAVSAAMDAREEALRKREDEVEGGERGKGGRARKGCSQNGVVRIDVEDGVGNEGFRV